MYVYIYIYIGCPLNEEGVGSKEDKENKKVLYHFAIFTIVNELLIIKNRRLSSAYCLMQARDEMRPSCDRALSWHNIFLE